MTTVLVAHASRRGSTAEIAGWVAEELRACGLRADVRAVDAVRDLEGYDAAVIGGALYAARWPRQARRFVRRHRAALTHLPVWMFSSGPLDDTATKREIPAPACRLHRLVILSEDVTAAAAAGDRARLRRLLLRFHALASATRTVQATLASPSGGERPNPHVMSRGHRPLHA